MLELADIIAPAVPPPAPLPYGWIALGIVLFILIALIVLRILWRRSRYRRAALAQLKRTKRALQQGWLDARAAAFQAALALRPALPTLSSRGRGKPASEWAEFMHALDHARYAPHAPSRQEAAQLLAQARRWIVRAP